MAVIVAIVVTYVSNTLGDPALAMGLAWDARPRGAMVEMVNPATGATKREVKATTNFIVFFGKCRSVGINQRFVGHVAGLLAFT